MFFYFDISPSELILVKNQLVIIMFKLTGSTNVYDISPNHSTMLVLIAIVEDVFPEGFRLSLSQCETLESISALVGSSDAVSKLLKAIEAEMATLDAVEIPDFYDEDGDMNLALEWASNMANTISSREPVWGATEEYIKQALMRLEPSDVVTLHYHLDLQSLGGTPLFDEANKLASIRSAYTDCLRQLVLNNIKKLEILPHELGCYIETMLVSSDWQSDDTACLNQMWTALSQGRVPSEECFEQTIRELERIRHLEAAQSGSIPGRIAEVIQFLTNWSTRTYS